MADSPSQEEQCFIHSSESEGDKSNATCTELQDRRTVRLPPIQFFERFHYSRLRENVSKSPFTKGDYQPGQEWIKGVVLCTWGTGAILLLNVLLTIIASGIAYSKSSSDKHATYAELYQGSCSVTKNWGTGMHLVINVLSTALLAASNYVMQCLSAPSRSDIDKAHSKRDWLDIGTFSIRNFWAMDAKRKILWILLLVSSLPVHMMFNSAIFPSITTIGYGTALIPNDLKRNESLVKDRYAASNFNRFIGFNAEDVQAEIFNGTFQNLSMTECVKAYNEEYNTEASTLLLVTDRRYFHNSFSISPLDVLFRSEENWIYQEIEHLAEGIEAWKQDGWNTIAGHWSYPNWVFTHNESDTWESIVDMPFSRHWTERNPDSWDDFYTLYAYILSDNPNEDQLEDFLKTASNWNDSSWAAELSFRTDRPNGFEDLLNHSSGVQELLPEIPISHCLKKNAEQRCQFYFNLPICVVVIACNIIKVSCMYLAARTNQREIFLTIGDSLSSFLKRPDTTTKGRCFMSWSDMTRGPRPWAFETPGVVDTIPLSDISAHRPVPYAVPKLIPTRKRWFRAASWKHWCITAVLFFACLAVSMFLYFFGASSISNQFLGMNFAFSIVRDLGIGKPSGSTIIEPGRGVIPLVLLANAPQLVFSSLYMLCNGLFTCMLAVAEYNDFATERKPLRVSWPKGDQRSTYWLSLPYRYSAPLITVSIVMHWLLSQSIFFVKINALDVHGRELEATTLSRNSSRYSLTACSYSLLAMFVTFIVGVTAVLALVGFSLRRLRSNMPLASSCSAAISAACHPPLDDTDASLKPVMWGEVPRDLEDGQDGRPSDTDEFNAALTTYAHCTFTSKEVVAPSMIRLYC